MAYKAPRTIINHPGVRSCESAPDQGADAYRHYIELKIGWVMPKGHRNEGGGSTFCNSVWEFKMNEPVYVGPHYRQPSL